MTPPRAKKGTLKVISGGFASRGETSNARELEVYIAQISGTVKAGKRPRVENEVVISFSEDEIGHVTCPHEDALVVTTEIDGYDVKRIIIDSGSSRGVLFLDALKNIGKSEKELQKVNFLLMGFTLTTTYMVGALTLLVFLHKGWKLLTLDVTFIVVDAPTSYNTILERSTLNPHRMIHSTYH